LQDLKDISKELDMKNKDFDYYVTSFFTKYLTGERNLSVNTISSYRDTFKLLLVFFRDEKDLQPDKVTLSELTRENILHYLDWLETNRGTKKSSRNIRLSAIHSFVKYAMVEDIDHFSEYQKILAIKNKKSSSRIIPYLTIEEVKAILSAPDTETIRGRRDKVLLTVMYDTAARVSEICSLKVDDIRLEKPETVRITGKGNKTRIVPIMGNTADILRKYIEENNLNILKYSTREFLFSNNQNHKLTRAGITYILKKYSAIAEEKSKLTFSIDIHPHVLRHSKAVHMLEAGVPLIYIRDFLGHVSVTTTEIYARVSQQNKRKVLENAYEEITSAETKDWNEDADLMKWLQNLTRK
jgi:site-specific recombinase XerD